MQRRQTCKPLCVMLGPQDISFLETIQTHSYSYYYYLFFHTHSCFYCLPHRRSINSHNNLLHFTVLCFLLFLFTPCSFLFTCFIFGIFFFSYSEPLPQFISFILLSSFLSLFSQPLPSLWHISFHLSFPWRPFPFPSLLFSLIHSTFIYSPFFPFIPNHLVFSYPLYFPFSPLPSLPLATPLVPFASYKKKKRQQASRTLHFTTWSSTLASQHQLTVHRNTSWSCPINVSWILVWAAVSNSEPSYGTL